MDEQIQIDFDPQQGLTHEESHILRLIQRGRANALSVRLLASMTGLKDVEVRQIVRHLIMEHGVLIASSVSKPVGFYIAETPEEIAEATRSLRHRGIMILMRAAKLQKISLEEIFNQSRMEYADTTGK
ncbi:hypothetical protein A45J_0386 [hot springs metagenome]|uniref:Uncharacterized protein n=1 Tax=hot springs metagenome TaxID=433727 RepID=A0A5J4KSK0_9ZZZZ